jgi:transcriptional regulator with XRE-family HTH domain
MRAWKTKLKKKSSARKRRKTKTGALLRRARKAKGLTLTQVARATGLQGGCVSHLEFGRSVPKITTAILLCNFYSVPLEKLIQAVVEDELQPVSASSGRTASRQTRGSGQLRLRRGH